MEQSMAKFLKKMRKINHIIILCASEKDLYQTFQNLEIMLKIVEKKLVIPAYELCIKASHCFNLLDQEVISVNERQAYILRIRSLVQKCCQIMVEKHE